MVFSSYHTVTQLSTDWTPNMGLSGNHGWLKVKLRITNPFWICFGIKYFLKSKIEEDNWDDFVYLQKILFTPTGQLDELHLADNQYVT